MKTEDHLTNHMSRRKAEELLAAEAQSKLNHNSAFEEAERLRMFNRCVNGVCSIGRRPERTLVTFWGEEVEV